ncbi:MAG: hypothetical protein AAGH48_01380 [Pseudomonadota bacterium]
MGIGEQFSTFFERLGRGARRFVDYVAVRYGQGLPRHVFDEAATRFDDTSSTEFVWAEFRPYLRALFTADFRDLIAGEKARVLLGAMDRAYPQELQRALDSVDYRGASIPADADLQMARYIFTGAALYIVAPVFKAPWPDYA